MNESIYNRETIQSEFNNAMISGKLDIPTKRRRQRSDGTAIAMNNPIYSTTSSLSLPKAGGELRKLRSRPKKSSPKNASSASYDTNQIPAFLLKTYNMIDTCDPSIASWTKDGSMFAVRDPDTFAREIIPKYFGHNKFSSFGRQLNFYGFRKIHSKPIKNADVDEHCAKKVVFHNEFFKRGQQDLLGNIRRSTRGNTGDDMELKMELKILKTHVKDVEEKMSAMHTEYEKKLKQMGESFEAKLKKLQGDFEAKLFNHILEEQRFKDHVFDDAEESNKPNLEIPIPTMFPLSRESTVPDILRRASQEPVSGESGQRETAPEPLHWNSTSNYGRRPSLINGQIEWDPQWLELLKLDESIQK